MIEQVKFTYSPLGKAFEKQTKIIENQGKKIKAFKQYGKQINLRKLLKMILILTEMMYHMKNKKKYVINFQLKELLNFLV